MPERLEGYIAVEHVGGPLDGRIGYCGTDKAPSRTFWPSRSGRYTAVYAARRPIRPDDWYVGLYFRGWRATVAA